MIDQQIFLEQLVTLSEWYAIDLESKAKIFYKQVDKFLTTEDFVKACDLVMAQERFFPPAATFVEKIYGTRETQAFCQLEMIYSNSESMSPIGKRALETIGGEWGFKNCTSPQSFLRKEFIQAFLALSANESVENWAVPSEPAQKLLPAFQTTESISKEIGKQLNRLNLTAQIPEECHLSKVAYTIQDLTTSQKAEYLEFLKGMKPRCYLT
jgi:hypothetical protein